MTSSDFDISQSSELLYGWTHHSRYLPKPSRESTDTSNETFPGTLKFGSYDHFNFQYPLLYTLITIDSSNSGNISRKYIKDSHRRWMKFYDRQYPSNGHTWGSLMSVNAHDFLYPSPAEIPSDSDRMISEDNFRSILFDRIVNAFKEAPINLNLGKNRICRTMTVSMPRTIFTQNKPAFNPLTIHYAYKNDVSKSFAGAILEVSNTFGEKHLYQLTNNSASSVNNMKQLPSCKKLLETILYEEKSNSDKNYQHAEIYQARPRSGYDYSWLVRRKFHVSPFNDLKGWYEVHITDPNIQSKIEVLIVLWSPVDRDEGIIYLEGEETKYNKKFMAKLTLEHFDQLPSLTQVLSKFCFVPLTYPRIVKQAFELAYKAPRLPIYPKPVPYNQFTLSARYLDNVNTDYKTNSLRSCDSDGLLMKTWFFLSGMLWDIWRYVYFITRKMAKLMRLIDEKQKSESKLGIEFHFNVEIMAKKLVILWLENIFRNQNTSPINFQLDEVLVLDRETITLIACADNQHSSSKNNFWKLEILDGDFWVWMWMFGHHEIIWRIMLQEDRIRLSTNSLKSEDPEITLDVFLDMIFKRMKQSQEFNRIKIRSNGFTQWLSQKRSQVCWYILSNLRCVSRWMFGLPSGNSIRNIDEEIFSHFNHLYQGPMYLILYIYNTLSLFLVYSFFDRITRWKTGLEPAPWAQVKRQMQMESLK